MANLLSKTVEHHFMVSQIYVMEPSGMQIFKTSGKLGDRSDRLYFQTALKGNLNYSDVLISSSTGKPIVVIALPIKRNSKIVGVIGASIDLQELSRLASDTHAGDTGYGFIVDKNGHVIGHPDATVVEEMKDLSNLLPVTNVIRGEESVAEYTYEKVEKVAAYTYLDQTSWGIIVQQPANEAFKALAVQKKLFLTTLIITLLLGIILARYIAVSITKPIAILKEKN